MVSRGPGRKKRHGGNDFETTTHQVRQSTAELAFRETNISNGSNATRILIWFATARTTTKVSSSIVSDSTARPPTHPAPAACKNIPSAAVRICDILLRTLDVHVSFFVVDWDGSCALLDRLTSACTKTISVCSRNFLNCFTSRAHCPAESDSDAKYANTSRRTG